MRKAFTTTNKFMTSSNGVLYMKRGSKKKGRKKKPAEYLTLLKGSLAERPAGLVAYR